MSKPARGLGRGFDSLIPTELAATSAAAPAGERIHEVPVDQIDPNPHQPRSEFEPEELQSLSSSIKEHGILQPLVVSRAGQRYQLIAGERRLRASKLAGLKQVPVIVRSYGEQHKLELALIENVQRAGLNPIETALAYKKLTDEFSLSLDQVGQRVGQAKSTVSNTLRLLDLPPEARKALQSGKISAAHGRALLAISDPAQRQQLLNDILEGGLSVRQAEAAAKATKGGASAKPSRPIGNSPASTRLAEQLSQHLGLPVKLKSQGQGGQVVINYNDLAELERIVEQLQEGRS